MLRNYITVALRSLRRHRSHAFINVTGLAVGMACCLLIALYVQDEMRYDRFHEKADRIYRTVGRWTSETGTRAFARVPPAVAPAMLQDVPEVEAAVRFQRSMSAVRRGDQVLQEKAFLFADASVFDVFTFPLLRGDPETALAAPYSVVLTEDAAARHFGDEDPMGQTFLVNDTLQFQVTGIARNVPATAHLTFDLLASFSTLHQLWSTRDLDRLWTSGTFYTYVLLAPPYEAADVAPKLSGFIEAHLGDQRGGGSAFSLHLQPLIDIHLHSDLRHEFQTNGNATYVYVFAFIGVFVLLIACINFMNLATARSAQRAREVGVRKTAGATRAQLIRQFLVEAVLLSLTALLLALVLVVLALPAFNELAGKALTMRALEHPAYLGTALLLALGVGVLAGSYPAFYLSRFRPAAVLNGGGVAHRRAGGTARLRQALVVFQFALSIFLIAGTLVAQRQLDHMRSQPLGFEQEHVVVLPFYWDARVQHAYETLKAELLDHAAVRHVTASGDVPGRIFTSMSIWGEGMPAEENRGSNALIVDPDFAETYGLEVVAGRDFAPNRAADFGEAFVLNEAAARLMGWTPEEAVGKRFRMNTEGPVIGVVRDFHYEGLQQDVEPMVMTVWPSWFGYVSARIAAGDVPATLAFLEDTWRRVVPDRPFEAFFLDEDFDRQYRAEERFSRVFMTLAGLAIFIACLGLFGLAAFLAERRTKEIGVRKVLGASVTGIAALLSAAFVRLVVVAFVVAAPVTYLAMRRWLADFAYRIDLSWWIVLLAGSLALAIALLTVGYQAVKAALANPVESLRCE